MAGRARSARPAFSAERIAAHWNYKPRTWGAEAIEERRFGGQPIEATYPGAAGEDRNMQEQDADDVCRGYCPLCNGEHPHQFAGIAAGGEQWNGASVDFERWICSGCGGSWVGDDLNSTPWPWEPLGPPAAALG